MHANTGCSASWAFCNDDYDDSVDRYGSLSQDSDSDDSEQELRDLEELLYSHVHYEPNYLCNTGNSDDLGRSDVQVTHLGDGILQKPNDVADGLSERGISATRNNADTEVVIIDGQVPRDEVAHTTTVAINLSAERSKRKAMGWKTSESADEIRTKYKKVDTTASPDSVVEVAAEKRRSLKSLNNVSGKHTNGQNLRKKKLKLKQKSQLSDAVAVANSDDLIVLDSASESSTSSSSSDIFCCDLSDDELYSDGADDIKLSNISVDVPQTSDADALTDVLNSLPGMSYC